MICFYVTAELADVAETKPSLSPASLQLRNCSSMTEKEVADDSVAMSERNGNGMMTEAEEQKPLNMALSSSSSPGKDEKDQPDIRLSLKRKRRPSNDSLDVSLIC